MRISKQLLWSCLGIFLVSWIFFLINIQFPKGVNFDEFHYVPSAKQFLSLQENQNWEHPPLGKELMAIGIGIMGDQPIGWRVMSTIFGSLTLVGMYLWGLAFFRRKEMAWFVVALTLFNHLLYVQARIGMLDTFMFCFMAWGMAAFTAAWDAKRSRSEIIKFLSFTGVMFGLASSCKWAAVVPWFFCIMLMALVRLFKYWTLSHQETSPWKKIFPEFEEWYSPDLFRDVKVLDVALTLGLIPLVAYAVTFLPFLWVEHNPAYTLWDLVLMQPKMYDGQLRVVNTHPYMSTWQQWATLKRPIWYAFEKDGEDSVRGVLLLGNPVVMWGGLVAYGFCLWAWLARRSREAFLIVAFYSALYFLWALIPRKVAFYYYYYPAGMVLSFALALSLDFLDRIKKTGWVYAGIIMIACYFLFPIYILPIGVAAGLSFPFALDYLQKRFEFSYRYKWIFALLTFGFFIYFFPILSALRIPADSFRKWMWFSSWI